MALTITDLLNELYGSLEKYDLKCENDTFFIADVTASGGVPLVQIFIYVDKIIKYKSIIESYKFNHKKLTSWLQDIFDIYVVPQKFITTEYKFIYAWATPNSVEREYSILNEILR